MENTGIEKERLEKEGIWGKLRHFLFTNHGQQISLVSDNGKLGILENGRVGVFVRNDKNNTETFVESGRVKFRENKITDLKELKPISEFTFQYNSVNVGQFGYGRENPATIHAGLNEKEKEFAKYIMEDFYKNGSIICLQDFPSLRLNAILNYIKAVNQDIDLDFVENIYAKNLDLQTGQEYIVSNVIFVNRENMKDYNVWLDEVAIVPHYQGMEKSVDEKFVSGEVFWGENYDHAGYEKNHSHVFQTLKARLFIEGQNSKFISIPFSSHYQAPPSNLTERRQNLEAVLKMTQENRYGGIDAQSAIGGDFNNYGVDSDNRLFGIMPAYGFDWTRKFGKNFPAKLLTLANQILSPIVLNGAILGKNRVEAQHFAKIAAMLGYKMAEVAGNSIQKGPIGFKLDHFFGKGVDGEGQYFANNFTDHKVLKVNGKVLSK